METGVILYVILRCFVSVLAVQLLGPVCQESKQGAGGGESYLWLGPCANSERGSGPAGQELIHSLLPSASVHNPTSA